MNTLLDGFLANLITVTAPIVVFAWRLSATLAQLRETNERQEAAIEKLYKEKQDRTVCSERHK